MIQVVKVVASFSLKTLPKEEGESWLLQVVFWHMQCGTHTHTTDTDTHSLSMNTCNKNLI